VGKGWARCCLAIGTEYSAEAFGLKVRQERSDVSHGYEATREAAMAAFGKSWRRRIQLVEIKKEKRKARPKEKSSVGLSSLLWEEMWVGPTKPELTQHYQWQMAEYSPLSNAKRNSVEQPSEHEPQQQSAEQHGQNHRQ
jgi:hypothetical protein